MSSRLTTTTDGTFSPQGVKWNPSGNYHSWLDGYYELSSGTVFWEHNGRLSPGDPWTSPSQKP